MILDVHRLTARTLAADDMMLRLCRRYSFMLPQRRAEDVGIANRFWFVAVAWLLMRVEAAI